MPATCGQRARRHVRGSCRRHGHGGVCSAGCRSGWCRHRGARLWGVHDRDVYLRAWRRRHQRRVAIAHQLDLVGVLEARCKFAAGAVDARVSRTAHSSASARRTYAWLALRTARCGVAAIG